MCHSHEPRAFPLAPLLGAGGLVLLSVIGVAWLVWFGGPAARAPAAAVVAVREMSFEDRADGSIAVRDAADGQVFEIVEPGEDGFLRATVRGLARARQAAGAGPDLPFRLERRANGQLVLIDPFNAREVDLWAFGTTNAEAFARLLEDRPATPTDARLAQHTNQESTP